MISKKEWFKKLISVISVVTIFLNPILPVGKIMTSSVYGASWAEPYLNNLVSRNIMRGDAVGNLYPEKNITRAEFAAMVNRSFGFTQKGKKAFSDVPKTAWYADDISIAANQGYLAGTGPSTAGPELPLTREQAVTLLCRAVKIEEKNIDSLTFADSKKFNNWSKGSIFAATTKGFISGFADRTFKPQKDITRAEVAKILSDMSGEIVNESRMVRVNYINGNVTLAKTGAGLRDTTIYGDLYITEGVGPGYVTLDNVKVLGDVIISGCGESNTGKSSIIANDCDFNRVIIDVGHDKKLSLIAEGDTTIKNTIVRSNAFLEERGRSYEAFEDIELDGPAKTTLDLSGEFDTVKILGQENRLSLRAGSIERLVVDEVAQKSTVYLENKTYTEELYTDVGTVVSGLGEIDSVIIMTDGTKIESLPNEITIRPGVTANINGKEMTSSDAELDKEDPEIWGGYPDIDEIEATNITALLKANKPGKIYWMIKLSNSDRPSDEELMNPKKDKGAIKSGNLGVAAEKEVAVKVSGLKSGEHYTFYVILEDFRENISDLEYDTFQTVDNVIPSMITGYPKAEALYDDEGHKLKFEAVSTKDGTIYWAVLPKNSVAPTADILIRNPMRVPGSIKMGTASCLKNELSTFYADGLEESTEYDVYMAILDTSGNESKVFKLQALTKDVTAPEFSKPVYPIVGAVTEKTVQMKFMTNESCTLYWAVFPRGTKVPASYEPTTPPPLTELHTIEAQQAVINGSNALKNGKTNAIADKEGNFIISGLEVQTPYDLYFVLVDKSDNKSMPVLKKEIITKDEIQPTAIVAFDESLVSEAGEPPVGSDIRLEFSEIVYDATSEEKRMLAQVPNTELNNFIKLFNTSNNPRTEVSIDFSQAKFSEEDGKTIVTFTTGDQTADNPALRIASGNRYVFELKDIADAAANKMKANAQGNVTRLPEFKTMAPFVNLKNIGSEDDSHDLVFRIEPKIQNAAEELCYDTILEIDAKITFDISVNDGSGSETTITGLEMVPNRYYSLQALMDADLYTSYIKFNELKNTTYSIKITKLEGVENKSIWNQRVNLTVRGFAGTRQQLIDAAFNGANGPFEGQASSLEASVVSDPAKLQCTKYFSDAIAPQFITNYPKLAAGDTSIRIDYMLDKSCTVYWLLSPKGAVATMPDAIKLIDGSIRPQGSKVGSFYVGNPNVEFTEFINDLKANTDYEFYYTAKGNVASAVAKKEIRTEPVVIPDYKPGYPQKKGQGGSEAYVDMGVIDADADVYWVVYETGTVSSLTPAEIAGIDVKPDSRVIDSGELFIHKDETQTITITNLNPERFYDIFIVMKNPMSNPNDGNWSTVESVIGITSADTIAPSIVDGSVITSITEINGTVMKKYNGSLSVIFSEPLYYLDALSGTRKKLDKSVLQQMLSDNISVGTVIVKSAPSLETDGGIISFVITFENVMANSSMNIPNSIIDVSGNTAGKLNMKFVANKEDPESSEWIVQFVK
ncbi:MAG: S-layer homology domain-containing protein [Anaerovorax sp.]|nr:S-layer homology domain-containing protein [Anaerovorax sp.]